MQAAGALRNVVCLSGGMTMLAVLAVTSVHAEPIGSGGSRAPLELTTRGMLLQRWDRNRDGKIDIGEAEMARTQMRRERIERAERSRIDPITGRRADDLFSADDEDDGDLFGRQRPSRQMPGLPGPAATTADAAAGSRAAADAEAAPDPSKAPTVTLFGPPPGLPPAAGASGAGAATLSSAARVLPQASGRSTLGGVNPSVPVGGSRPFERPTAPLGGAITGGVRAGAPAVRPGYGTTGTPNDLNAGLRGGSPADFRGVTQPGTSGGSMFRGFVPRGSSSLNAGRPATTQRPPTTPRPGSTPTDFYGP